MDSLRYFLRNTINPVIESLRGIEDGTALPEEEIEVVEAASAAAPCAKKSL